MVSYYFYHERNLIGKSRNIAGNKYRRVYEQIAQFKVEIYDPYKRQHLEITGITQTDINRKVALLNTYFQSVDQFAGQIFRDFGIKISSQSKFRPTILEEFCGFLFKDIPEITDLDLDFFNKKVFAGISLDTDGRPVIKTKDIDFCIGKKFDINIGEYQYTLIIPVIAIECKTYIDKTMFSEAQFTAQKMKQGSPNVKVYVIAEQNQIDISEIPSKSQTPIDQIYIIRGDPTNPLNQAVIFAFFMEIYNSLQNLGRENPFNITGELLQDY